MEMRDVLFARTVWKEFTPYAMIKPAPGYVSSFLELLLLFAFRASPFDCSVCGSQALLLLILPSRAILDVPAA